MKCNSESRQVKLLKGNGAATNDSGEVGGRKVKFNF